LIIQAYIKKVHLFLNGRSLSSIHTSSSMASTSPVILILGSGPNIGHHVGRAFVAKGYKVALASRSVNEEDKNAELVRVSADLSDPHCVKGIFSKVEASLGLPSVVVYNG
jgi:NAD(P)-dependent dehydrogenase (short-subunit alcohol dehydrogenase family)